MQDTIGKRIKLLRKTLGLNQSEFGNNIGVKQTTIAGYENEQRFPLESNILSICNYYNVNEDWLKSGEGNIFNEVDTDELFMKAVSDLSGDELVKKIVIEYSQLSDSSKEKFLKFLYELCDSAKIDYQKIARKKEKD